jgi:hypothetical protein
MITIPPPNVFNSGATDCPPDEAAATLRQSDDAAADIMESSTAVVHDAVNVLVAGSNPASPATNDIGEIFVGARKLIDPDENRFVLDVDRFMSELDEAPLFLRQA